MTIHRTKWEESYDRKENFIFYPKDEYVKFLNRFIMFFQYPVRLRRGALLKMGVATIDDRYEDELGSIDTGNVSHKCPTIHPYFAISETGVVQHTREFAQATGPLFPTVK